MSEMLRRRLAVGCALAALAIMIFPVFTTAQHPSRALVIKNVRIFDGSSIVPTSTVMVEDGKIKSVGGIVAVPDEAETIDGIGHTLLPGLIDSHTHAYGSALKQALMFGVTTEFDMFTDYRMVAQMRKEQVEGTAMDRADLFSAGTVVTAPGGHGTEYRIKIPTITGPDEAQAFVGASLITDPELAPAISNMDASNLKS